MSKTSYYNYNKLYNVVVENFDDQSRPTTSTPPPSTPPSTPPIDLPSKDPTVWGPHAWKLFHIMAENYPENPSPIYKIKATEFIRSIPFMIPCEKCSIHAMKFIDEREDKIINIVSSRSNLANFFVDFHNYVNARYGKKIYTYEEARNLYK